MSFSNFQAGLVHRNRDFWVKLGQYESDFLRRRIEGIPIKAPVYITGLARSGTTILLEILARHPDFAFHRYRSFPMIYTPYFWNRFLTWGDIFRKEEKLEERAHKDRLMVSPRSPESMEEMLWVTFFDDLHNPDAGNILDENTSNPDFEVFYREHIKKLLLSEGKKRYLSKANYNLTRIPYLFSMFPDARFLVVVRHPIAHVQSSMKQQELFCKEQRAKPALSEHTDYSGHFEFGLNRIPVNTGSRREMQEIEICFQSGDEVRGWALYWAHIYGYVYRLMEALPSDRRKTIQLVSYEALCDEPEATLESIFSHCGLKNYASIIAVYKERLSQPDYYKKDYLTPQDREAVWRITEDVAARFGYSFENDQAQAAQNG